MKTATRVGERVISGSGAVQQAYKLDPPFKHRAWATEEETEIEYVVASAVVAYSGPETLVFPADEDGEITDYLEVGGGRGYLCHGEALAEMGYEII